MTYWMKKIKITVLINKIPPCPCILTEQPPLNLNLNHQFLTVRLQSTSQSQLKSLGNLFPATSETSLWTPQDSQSFLPMVGFLLTNFPFFFSLCSPSLGKFLSCGCFLPLKERKSSTFSHQNFSKGWQQLPPPKQEFPIPVVQPCLLYVATYSRTASEQSRHHSFQPAFPDLSIRLFLQSTFFVHCSVAKAHNLKYLNM